MKPRVPIRVLRLTPHQFQRLRVLLLHILDGKVAQLEMTEAMVLRLFDMMQAKIGCAPYDKEERKRLGYRKWYTIVRVDVD